MRAASIRLMDDIHAAFIQGRRLFEGSVYIRIYGNIMLYYYAITGSTPAPPLTVSALVAVATEEVVLDTHPPAHLVLCRAVRTHCHYLAAHSRGGGWGVGGMCSDNMTMDYEEEG